MKYDTSDGCSAGINSNGKSLSGIERPTWSMKIGQLHVYEVRKHKKTRRNVLKQTRNILKQDAWKEACDT